MSSENGTDVSRGPLVWVELASGRRFQGWVLCDEEDDDGQAFVQRKEDDTIELVSRATLVGRRGAHHGTKNNKRSTLDRRWSLPKFEEEMDETSTEGDEPDERMNFSKKKTGWCDCRVCKACRRPVLRRQHPASDVEILSSEDEPSVSVENTESPRVRSPPCLGSEIEGLSSGDEHATEPSTEGKNPQYGNHGEAVACGEEDPLFPSNNVDMNKQGASQNAIEILSSGSDEEDAHGIGIPLGFWGRRAGSYAESSDRGRETSNGRPRFRKKRGGLSWTESSDEDSEGRFRKSRPGFLYAESISDKDLETTLRFRKRKAELSYAESSDEDQKTNNGRASLPSPRPHVEILESSDEEGDDRKMPPSWGSLRSDPQVAAQKAPVEILESSDEEGDDRKMPPSRGSPRSDPQVAAQKAPVEILKSSDEEGDDRKMPPSRGSLRSDPQGAAQKAPDQISEVASETEPTNQGTTDSGGASRSEVDARQSVANVMRMALEAQTNALQRNLEMQHLFVEQVMRTDTPEPLRKATDNARHADAIHETARQAAAQQRESRNMMQQPRSLNLHHINHQGTRSSYASAARRLPARQTKSSATPVDRVSSKGRHLSGSLMRPSSVSMDCIEVVLPIQDVLTTSEAELETNPGSNYGGRAPASVQRGEPEAYHVDSECSPCSEVPEQRNYLPSASTLEDTAQGRRRPRLIARKTWMLISRKRASKTSQRRPVASKGKKIRFDPFLGDEIRPRRPRRKQEKLPASMQRHRLRQLTRDGEQLIDDDDDYYFHPRGKRTAARHMNHRLMIGKKTRRQTSRSRRRKFFDVRWTGDDLRTILSLRF